MAGYILCFNHGLRGGGQLRCGCVPVQSLRDGREAACSLHASHDGRPGTYPDVCLEVAAKFSERERDWTMAQVLPLILAEASL